MSDAASVLAIHSAIRWITGVVSGLALVFFSVQLYWDRKILTQMFCSCTMRRIAVHRSTRICGGLNALLQVIASVDTLGVFGIYHVQLRIVLRLLSFLTVEPPLLFWVFFSAKPLFPFLFSNELGMLRRLKHFLIGYGSLGGLLYTIFYYTTEPAFVIPAMIYLLLFISTIWIMNIAVHVRARKIFQTTVVGSSKSNSQLTKVLRSWVRQSAAQSLILLIPFGVYTQLLLQSLSHIGLGDARPDYLDRNFAPTDSLNSRAIVGLFTSIMFSLFNWLYLYSSWRSRADLEAEFDKSTSLKRGKLSGSDSNSGGTAHCAPSGYASAEDVESDAGTHTRTKSVDAYSTFSEDDELDSLPRSHGGRIGRGSLASSSRRNSRSPLTSARNSAPTSPKRNSKVPLTSSGATVRDTVVPFTQEGRIIGATSFV